MNAATEDALETHSRLRWSLRLLRKWFFRQRLRFSLRALLLLTTLLSVAFGLLVESARRQRRAVDSIEQFGARVGYASLFGAPNNGDPRSASPFLSYMSATIGRDYFERAVEVDLSNSGINRLKGRVSEIAPHLAELAPLDSMSLFGLTFQGDDAERVFRSANPRRASCAMMSLSDSDAAGIACASNLRELGLNDVVIDVTGVAQFKNLGHLEKFWVSCRHNWITPSGKDIVWDNETYALGDEVATVLAEFPKLKVLSLSWTQLTDKGVDLLTRDDRYEVLGLSSPRITNASMPNLVRCKKLENLAIGGTQIGDSPLPLLQELPRLKALSLSGAMTNDGLVEVAKLHRLESLDLGGHQIDDSGLQHLHGMTSLRRLDVQSTGVKTNSSAVQALKKALPECYIHQYYPSPSFH